MPKHQISVAGMSVLHYNLTKLATLTMGTVSSRIELTQSFSFLAAGTPISSNVLGPFPGRFPALGLGPPAADCCGGLSAGGCPEGRGVGVDAGDGLPCGFDSARWG